VRCADTPGFIVNRLARPFYAEAFRLYEEQAADPATIDAVLTESGGFRMGPFELTDLIGQDVNEAVTRSVWEAFSRDARFAPSPAQRRLVASGRLGRKSGHGWFAYGPDAEPARPQTAEPCEAPQAVGVHTRPLGPLAAVHDLLREAGVGITEARVPDNAPEYAPDDAQDGASDGAADDVIILPRGTRLTRTDGAPATGSPQGPHIRLDLARDYRTCTRVALAPGADAHPEDVRAAIGLFQKLGKKVSIVADTPGMIVGRTVAMLIDFALDAEGRSVAEAADIDTAMKLGVNYPRGPLEWGEELGAGWVRRTLLALQNAHPGARYVASRPLRDDRRGPAHEQGRS
jgi:3-hydroxybutyryl-CoA dehydrogenase